MKGRWLVCRTRVAPRAHACRRSGEGIGLAHCGVALPQGCRGERSRLQDVRYGEMLLIQVQQTAACNALHPVEARLSRWLLQARDRLESNSIKAHARILVADARRAPHDRDCRRQYAAA